MTRPGLALAGLVGLVPLGWGLLQGRVSVEHAALRAVVLVVALAVVERVVLPLGALLVLAARSDRRGAE